MRSWKEVTMSVKHSNIIRLTTKKQMRAVSHVSAYPGTTACSDKTVANSKYHKRGIYELPIIISKKTLFRFLNNFLAETIQNMVITLPLPASSQFTILLQKRPVIYSITDSIKNTILHKNIQNKSLESKPCQML